MKNILVILILFFAVQVRAQEDALLKIDGDLMIHPDQISEFFNLASGQIRSAGTWKWESLQFVKPYRTQLSNVEAQGPWEIQFEVSRIKNQEIGFTLSWADPVINVGKIEIRDTISRTVGGVPVRIHLDGACSGMQLKIPGAHWQVSGKMHWDVSTQGFVPTWDSFTLQNNSRAVPQVILGQCVGPGPIFDGLRDALNTAAGDHDWLQDMLKQGILDWAETTLAGLHKQLLTRREFAIRDPLVGAWVPAQLSDAGHGVMRVAGQFVLSIPGSDIGADYLERTYDPKSLDSVAESGFVFPQDLMPRVLRYLYGNGLLQYRLSSYEVPAFQSLMYSRFMQFFVWPDLMNFAKKTQFYFDLRTQAVPQLGEGRMLSDGGSAYAISMPFYARQWAPTNNGTYLPYMDFSSQISGDLLARITDGNLNLQLFSNGLNLRYQFNREFAATRQENTRFAAGIIGGRVGEYLNSKPFSFSVPVWPVAPEVGMSLRDVQAWSQSFRVPLKFVPLAAP